MITTSRPKVSNDHAARLPVAVVLAVGLSVVAAFQTPGRSVRRSVLLPWEERTLDSSPTLCGPRPAGSRRWGWSPRFWRWSEEATTLFSCRRLCPGWGCWLRCLVRAR